MERKGKEKTSEAAAASMGSVLMTNTNVQVWPVSCQRLPNQQRQAL